mmetsp:Transcript_38765/g.75290  ORF Transcript_38765/g.75290 Transcript_38765/m.75290 type:complete len:161 (-) Transcript_38765:440-922(-)
MRRGSSALPHSDRWIRLAFKLCQQKKEKQDFVLDYRNSKISLTSMIKLDVNLREDETVCTSVSLLGLGWGRTLICSSHRSSRIQWALSVNEGSIGTIDVATGVVEEANIKFLLFLHIWARSSLLSVKIHLLQSPLLILGMLHPSVGVTTAAKILGPMAMQ